MKYQVLSKNDKLDYKEKLMICNADYVIPDANADFSEYILQCQQLIHEQRKDFHRYPIDFSNIIKANSPYEFKPVISKQTGKPYSYGVLLIHGLLDCPFSLLEIAQHLSLRQILCRSILLPGHGTKPEDLFYVKYQNWLDAVEQGIKSLSKEVDKLYIIGFSTGTPLALWHAINDTAPDGIIMISPAIRIKKPLEKLLNLTPLVKFSLKHNPWVARTIENDYTRYRSLALNGAYELHKLIRDIDIDHQKIDCPLLLIISKQDETICPKSAIKMFEQQKNPASKAIVYNNRQIQYQDERMMNRFAHYPDLSIKHFSHSALPFSQNNPHYGQQGDCPYASNYLADNALFGGYNRIEEGISNLLNKAKLSKKIWRELSYNPDFHFMIEEIAGFILSPESNTQST